LGPARFARWSQENFSDLLRQQQWLGLVGDLRRIVDAPWMEPATGLDGQGAQKDWFNQIVKNRRVSVP